MKYLILALDFIGIIFTIIGFFILSNQPPRFRAVVTYGNNEDLTRDIENAHQEKVSKWKEGMRFTIIGFIFQGLSIWFSIIE